MRFAPMRPAAIDRRPNHRRPRRSAAFGVEPLEGRSLLSITAGGLDTPRPLGGSSPASHRAEGNGGRRWRRGQHRTYHHR